jgi:hypothetical protein
MIEEKLNKRSQVDVSVSNTLYGKSNMSIYDKKELIVDNVVMSVWDVITQKVWGVDYKKYNTVINWVGDDRF